MRKNTRKGFTLIELLAVIIILGVLMLIAIPSVTEYINNSRRSTFLSSGSSFINAVTIKVNAGPEGLNLTDPTKAYYVAVSNEPTGSCVSLEKGGKSPFGTWNNSGAGKAYVIVVLNPAGTSYSYYFTAKDSAGYGMTPMKESQWTRDSVTAGADVDFPTATGDTIASTVLPGLPGEARDLEVEYITPATDCLAQ